MGGSYYDRDVSSTSGTYSAASNAVLSQTRSLHTSCNPNRWSEDKLVSEFKNPIVFALDVTGSMGDWSKVIYDKLPMFYGQIMMQGYLPDPAISFCAIGDAIYDDAPLQITEFGQGSQIDQLISKIYLEGGGGGNQHESYELAAYFYHKHCDISKAELPFLFITGDEACFDVIKKSNFKKVMPDLKIEEDVNTKFLFKEAMKKYNVFLLKKPYSDSSDEKEIMKSWTELIGRERILMLSESKACIDIALGAIALTSGARTLEGYVNDMKERGQSEQRIKEVSKALEPLAKGDMQIVRYAPAAESSGDNASTTTGVSSAAIDMAREHLAAYLTEIKAKSGIYAQASAITEPVPNDYLCPITRIVMLNPVTTVDGHTYEKEAIEKWFEGSWVSPMTGARLTSKTLIPNHALRKAINDFIQSHS